MLNPSVEKEDDSPVGNRQALPYSAPEIPSNRLEHHRKIYTVLCIASTIPRRGKKMDKPKPMQNNVQPSAPVHTTPEHKQNVFAMQSHSAHMLKQELVRQMTVLANFGITMKSRAMRCAGVTYKPNGVRERQRRIRQLVKKQG